MKKQLLTCLAILVAIAVNAQITLVKDINQGTGDSNPNYTTVYNGKMYFAADSGAGETTGGVDVGNELWISDGTPDGTMLLKDLNGTTSNSSPRNFFEFKGKFYFSAGSTVWTTDGTDANTIEATELAGSGAISTFVELDGIFYYTLSGPGGGYLIEFDGSTYGPAAVVGGNGIPYVTNPYAYNGKIYCYGRTDTESATYGTDFYVYDPVADTFSIVKDLNPGSGNGYINYFCEANGKLYFKAVLNDTQDTLWESDGTEIGTQMVVATGSVPLTGRVYAWQDKVFYEAADTNGIDQLFVYDPVAGTVAQITNVGANHDAYEFVPLGSYLYYLGENENSNGNSRLYRTDGATSELIEPTSTLDLDWMVTFDGKLYFEGDDDELSPYTYGTEFFMFDPATLSVSTKKLVGISNIYPNPAVDNITVDKSLVNAAYNIYDITGKVVKQGVIESQDMDLKLNTGLYIFKAQTDLGYFAQKLMVK